MTKKIIAVDLDGTLLNSDSQISDFTKETIKKVAEKGHKSVDLFQKLGNSYYFNANLLEANKWYGELFALGQEVEPEYYFRYAQTLKSVGDYAKANDMSYNGVKKYTARPAEVSLVDAPCIKSATFELVHIAFNWSCNTWDQLIFD